MKNIGFVGAGNMAQAIIKGIKNSAMNGQVRLFAFDVNRKMLEAAKVTKLESNYEIAKTCPVIILAVKPQNLGDVLDELRHVITPGHLLISIAAGVSIKKIQGLLAKKIAVVRVMPNTPALVGEGACGYCYSKETTAGGLKLAESILATFNRIAVKLPEKDINTVTALSGSGPAYFFYFAEAMLDAAKALKFDRRTAKQLIAQTMIGAGKMMMESDEEPQALRQKVTSKGGTTERAISGMEANGMKEKIRNAVIAAKDRADELGK